MSEAPKFKRHRQNNNIHIHAGLMNQYISILKKEYHHDDMGFETYNTKEICKCWAKIELVKTTVAIEATASSYNANFKFTIYYHPEIDSSCLIQYQGKEYQITSIENIEQANKYLIIMANLKGERDGIL